MVAGATQAAPEDMAEELYPQHGATTTHRLPVPVSMPFDMSPTAAQARLDMRKALGGTALVLGRGSYHDLARVTGLARQHITGVLQGRRNVSLATMGKIASAARIETSELQRYILAAQEDHRAKIAAGIIDTAISIDT